MKRKDLAEQLDRVAVVGHLFGLTDADMPQAQVSDVVGWYQEAPNTAKGCRHVCRVCQPYKPTGKAWWPVERIQLAATMTCTQCGTKLQDVVEHGNP
jgi:hypothetical protein